MSEPGCILFQASVPRPASQAAVMPARQGRWADLPHDLLQRAAGLLGNEDRLAMLDVCNGWAAAVQAAPALWPTAVLATAPSEGCDGQEGNSGYSYERELRFCSNSGVPFALSEAEMTMPQSMNSASQMAVLRAAAQVSPRARRIRLEGDARTEPAVTLAMLSTLPAGLRELELRLPCAGPLLPALSRFRQLQEVRITGSAAAVEWTGCGSTAALCKLTHMCLDCRQPMLAEEQWGWDYPQSYAFLRLSDDIAGHLAPATRLTSLELRLAKPTACLRCAACSRHCASSGWACFSASRGRPMAPWRASSS
ncbi:hypothetical protein ABPG75_012823 [Micractinium tetrahymenae]